VQGVGFRFFAERTAAELGVSGYVRNLDDGRVEVYAISEPEQMDELSRLLARGPRLAEVTGVDSREEAIDASVHGFSVR
jgi:acylphosphatase